MKNALEISVKKPCSEKFENFNPTGNGGFCGSCQKDVIDFTAMTSQQILNHFNTNAEKTCGRFKASQLKTYEPIMNNKTSTSFVSRGLAVMSFSLLSLCAVSNLNAQDVATKNQPNIAQTTSIEPSVIMGEIAVLQKWHTVTGTVLDEANLPLAGVNVVLKGTAEGVVTDFDGKFEFPRKLNTNDTLVFSYIGYETKEYIVSAGTTAIIDITITFDTSDIFLMGDVVVEGVYESKRSVFQKFIALFN